MRDSVEGFPDYQEYQRHQAKLHQEKLARGKNEEKRNQLLAEKAFLLAQLKEVDTAITSLTHHFIPEEFKPTRMKPLAVKSRDGLIVRYLKGMNGATVQQINEHIAKYGYARLRNWWSRGLVERGLIRKEGNTNRAYWYYIGP